jgi:hypothetical protein
MLSRRIASARPIGIAALTASRTGFVQRRCITQADIEDPNMVSLFSEFIAIYRYGLLLCLLFDPMADVVIA